MADRKSFAIEIELNDKGVQAGLERTENAVKKLGKAEEERGARTKKAESLLRGVETAQDRYNANVEKANTLFSKGQITIGEYHKAIDTYKSRLASASSAQNSFALTLGKSIGAMAGLAAGTAAFKLVDVASNLQQVDARLRFFAKSSEEAAQSQEKLRAIARELSTDYLVLADTYAKLLPLKNSNLISDQQAEVVLRGMTNAQKALGASNEDLKLSFRGFAQALSSSQLTVEDYNQTTEALPGLQQAFDRAMKATGGSAVANIATFKELINTNRELAKSIFLETAITALKEFEGAASGAANTIAASNQIISSSFQELAKSVEPAVNALYSFSAKTLSGTMDQLAYLARGYKQAIDDLIGSFKELRGLRSEGEEYVKSPAYLDQQSRKSEGDAYIKSTGYIKNLLASTAERYQVPKELALAVAQAESAFNQSAVSNKGAKGVMQVIDSTAAKYGLDNKNLEQNIEAGVKHLKFLLDRYKGQRDQLEKAIAAYNAGEGRVDKLGLAGTLSKYKETAEYLPKVLKNMGRQGVDVKEYEKQFAEEEALYKASWNRKVSIAEEANKRLSEVQKVQLQGMEAWAAQSGSAADQEQVVRARLALQKQEIESAKSLANVRIAALQSELSRAKDLEQGPAKILEIEDKLRASKSELTRLTLEQNSAELSAGTEIAAIREKQAEATAKSLEYVQALQAEAKNAEYLKALAEELAARGKTSDEIQRALNLERELIAVRERTKGTGQTQAAVEAVKATEQANSRTQQVIQKNQDSAKVWAQAWEQAARRVDDIFGNLWRDIFTGSKTVFQSIKNTFLSLLAEMAHAAITRPIMISILTGFGAPAGAATTSGSGLGGMITSGVTDALGSIFSGGVGGIGKLFGLGGSLASGSSSLLSGLFGGGGVLTSPTLGALFGNAAAGLGFGSAATSAVTSGATMAGMALPAGGLTAIVANLLGMKGGSQLANFALPTAGALGGGALAGALFGAKAGPIGSALGALVGAALSMLFKKAPPSAAAELTYGTDNAVSVTSAKQKAGGKSQLLVEIGTTIGQAFKPIEKALGVDLGKIGIGLRYRDKTMTIAGSDASGKFFSESFRAFDKKGRVNEAAIKDEMDRFGAAALKRDRVLRQIDDVLIRGAIRSSERLSEVASKLNKVQKIRVFTGERTELGPALEQLQADFEKYEKAVKQFTKKRERPAELAKVTEAYQEKFSDSVFSLRDSLRQATTGESGSITSTIRNIKAQFKEYAAQNRELAKAAEKSKGKLKYTPLTDAELATMQQAAIRTALLASSGAIQKISSDLSEAIQDINDMVAGPGETIKRLSAEIFTGFARLETATSAADQEKEIDKISNLIEKRYRLEISAIQATVTAAKSLKSTVEDLRLGELSPLLPAERLAKSKEEFDKTISLIEGGDRSAENLAKAQSLGQEALSLGKQYLGSSSYVPLFNDVTSKMFNIADMAINSASSDMKSLQGSVDDLAKRLIEYVERAAKAAENAPSENAKALSLALQPQLDISKEEIKYVRAIAQKAKAIPDVVFGTAK